MIFDHPALHPALPGERRRLATGLLALSTMPTHRLRLDPLGSARAAMADDDEGDEQQLELAERDAAYLARLHDEDPERALWRVVGLEGVE